MERQEFDPKLQIALPRLMFLGTNRGIGTSTILLGLLVCYKRQNFGVGTAKIGPSLAEPTHHRRVISRLSYTLDPWLLTEAQLRQSLIRLSGATQLALIEGNEAIFDYCGEESNFYSPAAMAQRSGTPIILLVDARGYQESIAAHVAGFMQRDPAVKISGVIANRVKDKSHNKRLRRAIESLDGPQYLGGVPAGDPQQMGGTLVGIQMYNPSALTRNRLLATGNLLAESVDRDALLEIAQNATPLNRDASVESSFNRLCKIAVADDQAFHLTVQDNLDLIRRVGAELVAFSPIADRRLPTGVQGLYLPGGYPQLYAADLSNNRPMLQAIRDFVAAGGVLYAEAGAAAYLCKKMTLYNGSSFEMVGVLSGVATAMIDDAESPTVTYEEVSLTRECILGPPGGTLRGFRDNRWSIRFESAVDYCFDVRDRPQEDKSESLHFTEGISPRENILITKLNLHWASAPVIARQFVERVKSAI